ncbi:hypothetical protein EON64_07410 [archaeon]|nr:MAG: hypothetical protein EON64_07410 [archaeon]
MTCLWSVLLSLTLLSRTGRRERVHDGCGAGLRGPAAGCRPQGRDQGRRPSPGLRAAAGLGGGAGDVVRTLLQEAGDQEARGSLTVQPLVKAIHIYLCPSSLAIAC